MSTKAVFTTSDSRGNSPQTAVRTRSAAGADTFSFSEGEEIGEPPDSYHPTTPKAANHIRQPTARSARRFARHAVASAVSASAVLTTAVPASAVLTTAVSVAQWGVLPPGGAGNASALFLPPHQTPLPLPLRFSLSHAKPCRTMVPRAEPDAQQGSRVRHDASQPSVGPSLGELLSIASSLLHPTGADRL